MGRVLLLVQIAWSLSFFISPAYAGVGGELAPSFPVVDAEAGKQESTASVVDRNGDVIVTGYQNLSGGTNDDYYTVKFKGDGSGIAWRAYFDKAGGSDVATAVAVDKDNNVIVTGYVWNGVNLDIHTIKYDGTSGSVLWQHTYDGSAHGNDVGTTIGTDAGGSIYVAGYSQNGNGNDDCFILKYAAGGGDPQWEERFGNLSGIDRLNAIAVGATSIAATGYSWNGTKFEIVTRTYGFDKSFLREWRFASVSTGADMGKFVAYDPSGKIVITGTVSNTTDSDIYTAKYDPSTGAVAWERIFNGGFEDEPKGVALDSSGDVYVTGYTWTLAGRYDLYTARYGGSDGSIHWEDVLNTGVNNDDVTVPYGIVVDKNAGAVYVTGYAYKAAETNYDVVLVKYNITNGSHLWRILFDGLAHRADQPVGIGLNTAGDVLIGAWSERITDADFILLKFDRGALFGPTGLNAVALTDTSARLTWTDNAADEDGFLVERKLGERGTWGEVKTLAANTVSWTDPDLVPNNYYYYRVRAYKTGGTYSHYSNEDWVLSRVVTYTPPNWTYIFNNIDNKEDYAEGIAVGPDDNPVVTGRSDRREVGVDPPAFSYDYYTVKLDRADSPQQRVLWEAVYDSGDGGMDMAKSLIVNNRNEVFVTGNAYVYWPGAESNTNDVYTLKYPAAGPPEAWHHQYNGPAGGDDRSTSIASAVDGSNNVAIVGYGVNGQGNSDIYVMKLAPNPVLDEFGNAAPLWTAPPFNGGGDDYPTAVTLDRGGNVYVAGYTTSGQYYKWYVAKHDAATGQILWSDTYGFVQGDAVARSIAVDSNGNAFVTGYVTTAPGQKQMYTIKYDGGTSPVSRILWKHELVGGTDDQGVSVKVDPINEAVVVGGTHLVSPGNHDFHLIRYTNAEGTIVWEQNFERPLQDDHAVSMAMDSSGYVYLAGNTSNGLTTDIMSVIFDYNGNFLHAAVYNGSANDFDEAKDVTVNYRGEAFIAGYSTNESGNADYVVYKQKNDYILVPAPFTAVPDPDFHKVNLSWRSNTPDTGFHVWRTQGAISQYTVWTPLSDQPAGITSLVDTGLEENTLYCYMIDAFSGSLSSRQITVCATTTLRAPALAAPSAISASQLTLSWEHIPGNSGYKIERKVAAGSWEFLANNGQDAETFVDGTLAPGTQYTYRVSSLSAAGTSLTSNEQTVFSNPVPPVVNQPAVVTSDRIDFSWNAVFGATGYRIERKTGGGNWALRATVPADPPSFSDTPLTDNTQYSYRVFALNASGESLPSNEISLMTRVVSPALAAPVIVSSSQVDHSWSSVAGATGYSFQEASCGYSDYAPQYCDLGNDWAWSGWYEVINTTATTYQRTGLAAGTKYRYRIVALIGSNYSDPSNVAGAWTWMVTPTLSVIPTDETSLTVTWSNVSGETNFTVERKQGPDGTWGEVPAGTGLGYNNLAFTDTGLERQTSYCYRVKAYSAYPDGPPAVYSGEVCLATPLPAPVLGTLALSAGTQINLTWNQISGNTGYDVERCTINYPNNPEYVGAYGRADWLWSCSAPIPVPQDQNFFNDPGLSPGYTYLYRVRDNYTGGMSGWSNFQYATTTPTVPTITVINAASTSQIDLNWTDVYGETSWQLEWKEGAEGTWAPITMGENLWYYSHTGLTSGVTYYYRIRALNDWGDSGPSTEVSKPTLLVSPSLDVPSDVRINSVTLTWNDIPGNSGYKIQRKTGAGGTWEQIGTSGPGVATYIDPTPAPGTLYSYRVLAVNGGGDSAPSNEQSTTTTPDKPIITLSAPSIGEIDISWKVVLGATNYKIQTKVQGGSYGDLVNKAVSYGEDYCGIATPTVACSTIAPVNASQPHTGLSANTTYCYQMIAWNSTGGDSVASDEKCLSTASLQAVTLAASAVNAFKVQLDWALAACSQGTCELPDGFEIEKQLSSGQFGSMDTVSGSTSTYSTSWGIDPSTTYTFRVRPYRLLKADFNGGIESAAWSQRGVVRTAANGTATDTTAPPINVVDATNGNAIISGNGGAIRFTTTSPGDGTAESYNFTRINLLTPGKIRDDFEMSIDYRLPDGQVTKTQYHVYGRLQVNFPNTSGGDDVFYVERTVYNGVNSYGSVFTVDGVNKYGYMTTSDTSGKLKISRSNGKVACYVWTNGAWAPLAQIPHASTAAATYAGFSQYVQRNEEASLRIEVDNFSAITNRSQWSNGASVTTPGYTPASAVCQ